MNTKRCAIYTRKSSEEGLEQDFNSLHAQREACEAYIVSQKHEGWKLIKTPYDDGGYSGGNINRPALQQLLEDIESGKIDVIVVYKVDRLSRSLHDFAKMVEVFDTHRVSFVSVTQQFNTTTSMGRLTLNMLLSFAQFEREVTGERIRDKIAASKRKGMWMGGRVPLGYEVKERKLLVVEKTAETVRQIYWRYLEMGCVRLLQKDITGRGIRSVNGNILSRGTLYKMLSNPIYIGQIRHKSVCHPGQHDAIIDQVLWDQVQQLLATNKIGNKTKARKTEPSLLLGKLFDASAERLVPVHANKKGRRYRYYVSQSLANGTKEDATGGWRLPGQEIEATVVRSIRKMLGDRSCIAELLHREEIEGHHIHTALTTANTLSQQLASDTEITKTLSTLLERVDLRQDGISITLSLKPLMPADAKTDSPLIISQLFPMRMKRCGVEMRLVIDGATTAKTDPTLIKTIARAHGWFQELRSGHVKTLAEIASREAIDKGTLSRMIQLAFLAPDIVESIITGSQPAELNTETLLKRTNLPIAWTEQKQLLGIA